MVGAGMALLQRDLKGLLAYSTISHLGLITLLFGLDTQLSTVAALFHILNHAVFKASLFAWRRASSTMGPARATCNGCGACAATVPHTALLAIVALVVDGGRAAVQRLPEQGDVLWRDPGARPAR
ncbi:proton-conducting transporter transmembrane domain-containing protein [Cupriavidus basilensis]